MQLKSIWKKICCLLGRHEMERWSQERCRREGAMWGIWAPGKCRVYGYESQVFPIPLPPPELRLEKQD